VVSNKSYLGVTSKELRKNTAEIATEDAPRLLGRERSLAIPWHVLEGDKKRQRHKMESGYGPPSQQSSRNVVTSASQLNANSMVSKLSLSTENVPVVVTKDLPRLLGRDRAAIFGRAETDKSHQRHRKAPCYGSSCCESSGKVINLASQHGECSGKVASWSKSNSC